MKAGIIALLTDFGTRDAYAGIMKGVLLSLNPSLKLIDLSHDIDCHNILSASYVLHTAWDYFPNGTVFCVVVDPGVGSGRSILIGGAGGKILIAPDNGIASLPVRMHRELKFYTLKTEYLESKAKNRLSSTFHGRDIFAPAAALAAGGKLVKLKGAEIKPMLLKEAFTRIDKDRSSINGSILHIDRFGNCITSVHRQDLNLFHRPDGVEIYLGSAAASASHKQEKRLPDLKKHYSEVGLGKPLTLIGSAGFLEIAVREGSAAVQLGINVKDEVHLHFIERKRTS